jgi:tetratricopeptide (TPR) repeat protein
MKRFVAAFVVAMGLAAPAAAQPDAGPLGAAKDLYASARYDEALTVLNGLRSGDQSDYKSVEQYRSLCLLALGRATEAETAIAAVVTADPTYQPAESDASPRVRATFTDVRRRLLPEIAATRYAAAKASYDRHEWAAAEQQFRTVLGLIDDPDTGGKLQDLRMLTAGFLELSAKAAAPPPPPPAPAPAPPVAVAAAPAAPAAPEPGKVYGSDDRGVVPPASVRQEIPKVPIAIISMAKPVGQMEVTIDEQGRVVAMAVRGSIHPAYDSQLLSAARDWRYQPATFNGYPVKFRKLIQITVKR